MLILLQWKYMFLVYKSIKVIRKGLLRILGAVEFKID
jgi:hypothetical protein